MGKGGLGDRMSLHENFSIRKMNNVHYIIIKCDDKICMPKQRIKLLKKFRLAGFADWISGLVPDGSLGSSVAQRYLYYHRHFSTHLSILRLLIRSSTINNCWLHYRWIYWTFQYTKTKKATASCNFARFSVLIRNRTGPNGANPFIYVNRSARLWSFLFSFFFIVYCFSAVVNSPHRKYEFIRLVHLNGTFSVENSTQVMEIIKLSMWAFQLIAIFLFYSLFGNQQTIYSEAKIFPNNGRAFRKNAISLIFGSNISLKKYSMICEVLGRLEVYSS